MFQLIRIDCYWYHREHDMGASIDCCTLAGKIGECPCSVACNNFISNADIAKQLKYRIPTNVDHEETIHKCCTCPTCKNVLDRYENWFGKQVTMRINYCPICGQALNWSDEENQMVRM